MHPEAYREMAATEERHWWFAGRRAILGRVLGGLKLAPDASILEIGAGTGGNLEMLSRFGRVSAVEMCPEARDMAQAKACGCIDVRLGAFPQDDPFPGERFDLICLFDVLEHMPDDVAALAAMRQRLAPGGRVLLTVPACPWLWSRHDEFLYHKRRYTRASLLAAAAAAGMRAEKLSAMNTLLFPLLAAVRGLDRLRGEGRADAAGSTGSGLPPAPVNACLRTLFSLERLVVSGPGLPFGASLLAVLRPEREAA